MRSAAFHAHVYALFKRIFARTFSLLCYATGGTRSLEKQAEIEEDADANYGREDVV